MPRLGQRIRRRSQQEPPAIPGTRWIAITQGKFALVDERDYEAINRYAWAYNKRHRYAFRRRQKIEPGNSTHVRMHRQILAIDDPSVLVDHRNGNRLDCRRENLRTANDAQNARNNRGKAGRQIAFKGVYRSGRPNKPWSAKITVDKKTLNLDKIAALEEKKKAESDSIKGDISLLEEATKLVQPCIMAGCTGGGGSSRSIRGEWSGWASSRRPRAQLATLRPQPRICRDREAGHGTDLPAWKVWVMGALCIVPMTITEAKSFVAQHHRHHGAPLSGLFAIAAADGEAVQAVVIVGRPMSRVLDDGWTVEVTRLCARPNIRNACSMLYAAAWRAAKAMGYRKLVTYTLASEPGVSLRAAGLRCVAEIRAKSWHTPSRPRVDKNPMQRKLRWEFSINEQELAR
jgi:hypothetical protein